MFVVRVNITDEVFDAFSVNCPDSCEKCTAKNALVGGYIKYYTDDGKTQVTERGNS